MTTTWGCAVYQNMKSVEVRDAFVELVREHPLLDNASIMGLLTKRYGNELNDENVLFALADLALTFNTLDYYQYALARKAIENELNKTEGWANNSQERNRFLYAFQGYLTASKVD